MPEVTNGPHVFLPQSVTTESTTGNAEAASIPFDSSPALQNLTSMQAQEVVEATLVGIPPIA